MTCIRQTAASHPKFAFTPTFMFGSPICPNNCGVVFLWKYILVFEKWLFSFDRSNMQIFTVNITRVVWPRVMNILDLRYFCQHNPLFYHLNLVPLSLLKLARKYFLVNIFSDILFAWYLEKPFRNYCFQKTKMSRFMNDSFAGGSQRIFTKVNLVDKLLIGTDLLYKRLILHAYMETVQLSCSLVGLVGLVIEKTELAYL